MLPRTPILDFKTRVAGSLLGIAQTEPGKMAQAGAWHADDWVYCDRALGMARLCAQFAHS